MQIAGVVFPVPILLLIPAREYLLPRLFGRNNLSALDPAPYEDEQGLKRKVAEQPRSQVERNPGHDRPANENVHHRSKHSPEVIDVETAGEGQSS